MTLRERWERYDHSADWMSDRSWEGRQRATDRWARVAIWCFAFAGACYAISLVAWIVVAIVG